MNKLTITFPNGHAFLVDSEVIAHDRATYYADREFEKSKDNDEKAIVYEEEFEYAMSDFAELKDWAYNNMNWSDLSGHAFKVETSSYDYEENWCEAEITE